MVKIHLLVRKEEISEEKMRMGTKLAVVLDVLLATTTITSALRDGAIEVIPVLTPEEGLEIAKEQTGDFILAGELNTKSIEGFVYPNPTEIRKMIRNKTLILSTTNGTVALRKSAGAKKVYIASLLNNEFVARRVHEEMKDDYTIVVVCSGNSGEFSLEDFYGAGHFISCLIHQNKDEMELSDAAKAALSFYQLQIEDTYEVLHSSYVGELFSRYGIMDELLLASQKGIVPIVPILEGKRVVREKTYTYFKSPRNGGC